MKTFTKMVRELEKKGYTIATMESCTGGGVANAITNISGSSNVLKFSAVTYSNEYKIKMGVSKDTIDKYSVYSMKVAHEMALNISKFTNSTIGIGITGKLNKADPCNKFGIDNEVFISIYFNNVYYDITLFVDRQTRKQNKDLIISAIIDKLDEILNN